MKEHKQEKKQLVVIEIVLEILQNNCIKMFN